MTEVSLNPPSDAPQQVCYFCKKNPAVPTAAHPLKMYRKKKDIVVAKVLDQLTFQIPRCNSCKKIHSGGNNWIILLGILGTLVGGGIGISVSEEAGMNALIFLSLAGLVVGLIVGKTIDTNITNKANVLPLMPESFLKHPEVAKARKEGYEIKLLTS